MKQLTLSLLIVLIALVSSSAQKRSFSDIEKILEKAVEHMANDQNEEAILELEKIPKYDSTYETSALELSKLHTVLGNYEEALVYCNWGIAHNGKFSHLFHQNKSACYLSMDKFDRAMETVDSAMILFPKNTKLLYNKGLIYKQMKEYGKAKEVFQEVIRKTPYLASAHYELGALALRDNETARMMMCFNMYLMCEGNKDKGNQVLTLLNHLASSKKDSVPVNIFSDSGEDFAKINLLLDNYVALDKGYKTGVKVNLAAIKQNHLLFSQLAEKPVGKDGFWNEFYVPIFRDLYNSGQFANYAWYVLQYSKNDDHLNLVKKNASGIEKFGAWLGTIVAERWNIIGSDESGDLATLRLFYDNDMPQGIGPFNKKTKFVEGAWEYYKTSGSLSAKGMFKNNEKHGAWQWYYPNGKLESSGTFDKGKVDGEMPRYYENGNPKSKGTYKAGEREGMFEEYYADGRLKGKVSYKDGTLNGPNMKYFANGFLSDSLTFEDATAQGDYRYYHSNGKLRISGSAKDDQRSGLSKEYYSNGALMSEYNYVDGKPDGLAKEYFITGELSFEGRYKDGNRVGTHSAFYPDGSKKYVSEYDESGTENGGRTTYDRSGNPHELYVYTKGLITAYKFVDDDGKVIIEAKKKGQDFDYKSIYFDGTQESNGLYSVKGAKQGTWEFYNSDGVRTSKLNYKDNVQDGYQTYYFPNGKVKSEYNMVDGEIDGEFKDYYYNGQLQTNCRYDHGAMEGELFEYRSNGQLESIDYYIHDNKSYRAEYSVENTLNIEVFYEDGLFKHFKYYDEKGKFLGKFDFVGGDGKIDYRYANGQTQGDAEFILGNKHGRARYFEFDGRVSSDATFNLGRYEGIAKFYHENKQLKEHSEFADNERHGIYKRWNWFGELTTEGTYVYGQLEGTYSNYYPDGTLESSSQYVNDELHGKREFFAPNGDLQMIRYYDHGLLTGYSYLGSDGKPVAPIAYDKKDFNFKAYFPNGQVSREYRLERGMLQGKLMEYLPDGTITYEGTYVDDGLEGTKKNYDKQGKLYSTAEYKADELNGMFTIYWPNGQKRLELPYLLGEKSGTGYEYDKAGKKTIEYTFSNNQLTSEKVY